MEAIREYVQLALKGEETKAARKEILMEAKESLEARLMEMQESLDVINYKLDTYEQKCGPIDVYKRQYKCRSMLMLRIDLHFFAQKEKYYA